MGFTVTKLKIIAINILPLPRKLYICEKRLENIFFRLHVSSSKLFLCVVTRYHILFN